MTAQEYAAYGIGLLALGYMAWRYMARRAANTCCGEKECPAAKRVVDRL